MIKNFIDQVSAIKINLASAEKIRWRSYGEITNPETVNYKTLKAEKGGLFDEAIFGPIKNYECSCGKYKKSQNRGRICERCGVEITESIVRRQRMGHIELDEPVAHIWMFKSAPSRIALTLDMKAKSIEEIIYFVSYVVLDSGTIKHLPVKTILDIGNAKNSKETRISLIKAIEDILKNVKPENFNYTIGTDLITELKNPSSPFSMNECVSFIHKHTGARFGTGARAIEELLSRVDIEGEIRDIWKKLNVTKSMHERSKLIKRLHLLEDFKKSNTSPTWMILRAIPVIPPETRAIIKLDGGRVTASTLNDLYRRIIIRNKRLKRLKLIRAPDTLINNERRTLQEAVDALFDNERKARPILGRDNKPLKSLTSILKGKQGRFRQNLLGKRVDYSGRSVIVCGPDLKMYQCGIPYEMAVTLFKPFLVAQLIKDKVTDNIRIAEQMIANKDDRIWEKLRTVVKGRPVLLNRAPTLHRLGIQAFEGVLVEGKAILLSPLVTSAFNADFDGDQMAIHAPITEAAIAEARGLMLASKNVLGPKDGKPIAIPTQDIVLGIYYLTKEKLGLKGQGTIFSSVQKAILAYETNRVDLHALIAIATTAFANKTWPKKEPQLLITTIGKLIFNKAFTCPFNYINSCTSYNDEVVQKSRLISFTTEPNSFINSDSFTTFAPLKKGDVEKIIDVYYRASGEDFSAKTLDEIKNAGFHFSEKSGATVSIGDIRIYKEKAKLFEKTEAKVKEINAFYDDGVLTKEEKDRILIQMWSETKEKVQDQLSGILKDHPDNPIYMMLDSSARGNLSQFTQLAGMRGLMNNPKGEVLPIPIKNSFREGLHSSDYFNSTHGARKGETDVALKTADSGYLTRRLVDVTQGIIIDREDCHTSAGFVIADIVDEKYQNVIVSLQERLQGRFLSQPITLQDGIVIDTDHPVTHAEAEKIVQEGHKEVIIRSNLICESPNGLCVKCYGIDLSTGNLVKIGVSIGVMAAQSIGEPGTQLTMRTFHSGGVAGTSDITQGLPRIKELLDVTTPKGTISVIATTDGVVKKVINNKGFYDIVIDNGKSEISHHSTFNAIVRVKKGDHVKCGEQLTDGVIDMNELLEVASAVKVQKYILQEVHQVYRLQGIVIADAYIEILIRQMLSRVQVIGAGETDFLPGSIIKRSDFKKSVINCVQNNLKPPVVKELLMGIKKISLDSESFLAASSFQDTTRVLVKAVLAGKLDDLTNFKSSIMIGKRIHTGTGLMKKKEILQMNAESLAKEY